MCLRTDAVSLTGLEPEQDSHADTICGSSNRKQTLPKLIVSMVVASRNTCA